LQVGFLYKISIHDSQVTYTRACQSLSLRRPQRPATDYQDTRREQTPLPRFANPFKENLPAITLNHKKEVRD
jgi:hypothetical protein